MCGIAGIVSFKDKIDAKYINQMTDIISYRGPDDEGAIIVDENRKVISFKRSNELNIENKNGKILFGHRRLSILDLTSAGHQPMGFADNTLWITYNGEIYNYLELRDELRQYGYRFQTNTDTEVIMASYHKWGENCLYKFNGMWSFAIYNANEDKIFCAVDHSGIKPFFYSSNDNNTFCFSSEIKQLYSLNWIGKTFNDNIVSVFGYPKFNDNSNTIFSGIHKLEAGEKITVSGICSGNKKVVKEKWYEFNTIPSSNISEDDAALRLSELFYDSIRLRLRSDVPVGTALSGGVDSSLIVLLMDKILKETNAPSIQKTFTSGSEDSRINEIPYAREVIKLTNSEGHFIIPDSNGFIDELERMYYHIEIPYISSTCYASWCVYKHAKANGIIVTLDGQGADETLAGYDIHMYPFYQVDFLMQGKWKNMINNSAKISELYGLGRSKQTLSMIKQTIKSNELINNYYENSRMKKESLFDNRLKTLLPDFNIHTESKNGKFSNTNVFAKKLSDYFYKLSLPVLLHTVDRTSMAHSVEARLPFLDNRLLDFIYSLPHDYKIKNGITKYILKKAYKDILPEQIVNRYKLGFNTAEEIWFKQKKAEICNYVNERLNKIEGLLNVKMIKEIFSNKAWDLYSQKLKWDILSIITVSSIFNIQ